MPESVAGQTRIALTIKVFRDLCLRVGVNAELLAIPPVDEGKKALRDGFSPFPCSHRLK